MGSDRNSVNADFIPEMRNLEEEQIFWRRKRIVSSALDLLN